MDTVDRESRRSNSVVLYGSLYMGFAGTMMAFMSLEMCKERGYR